MSFRSLLYENFDDASHVSLGGAIGEPQGAAAQRPPRPRTELEMARHESFAAGRNQGFAEGRRAALEDADVRLAHDLPALLVNLGGAAAAMEQVRRDCARDALRLTRAALRQMLPIVAERGLAEEAAALVADVIAKVPAPVIEVRAAPRTRETIERRCGPLPPGVTVATDPELAEGGVRCAWADGQARFDGATIAASVLAILDRCLDRSDQGQPLPQAHAQKED